MFKSQNRISTKSRKIGTFAVLALLISVLPSVKSFWSSNEDSLWKEAGATFFAEVQQLEEKFPMQSEDTWLQITSTVAKTLKAEPPQHPAVITALLPPDLDTKFSTCFLHRIAISVNKAVKPVLKSEKGIAPLEISSQSFEQQSITDVRHNIDTYFQTQGKALLVLDIQNFTNADNLQVFHGICDNYHSVDSRATILFPVRVPEHIYLKYKEWKHSMGGTISNEVLTESWQNVVNRNTGPALIARVADAVILLNNGDTCDKTEFIRQIDGYVTRPTKPVDVNLEVSNENMVAKINVLAEGLLKLSKNALDSRHQERNHYLTIKKELEELKLSQKELHSKFDAFIITDRKRHETDLSNFCFERTVYIALGVVLFATLIRTHYVANANYSKLKKAVSPKNIVEVTGTDSTKKIHIDSITKTQASSDSAKLAQDPDCYSDNDDNPPTTKV